jgi:hypothetical protein
MLEKLIKGKEELNLKFFPSSKISKNKLGGGAFITSQLGALNIVAHIDKLYWNQPFWLALSGTMLECFKMCKSALNSHKNWAGGCIVYIHSDLDLVIMRLYESGICKQLQKKYLDDKYLDQEKRQDSCPDVFHVQHLFGG